MASRSLPSSQREDGADQRILMGLTCAIRVGAQGVIDMANKKKRRTGSERPTRSHLQIRVSPEDKETIRRAAETMGLTISEFVLIGALDAADRLGGLDASGQWPAPLYRLERQDKIAKGTVEDVPHLFQQRCKTAGRGGHQGYDNAGYELARHLDVWIPREASEVDWKHALWNLSTFIRHRNEYGIIDWCRAYYPAFMELVPRRRWPQFARGVIAAARDRQIHDPDGQLLGVHEE